MKIAFDVDGILTNLQEFEIKYGRRFFGDQNKPIDTSKLRFKEMFNCSQEEEDKFWKKYIWRYCLLEKARKDASLVMNKLKEEGDEIYILTARAHTTEQNTTGRLFRSMLKYFLRKENIPYDHIFYYDEETSAIEKTETCINEKIEFAVDDQSKNINCLKTVTNVSYFEENHNKDCKYDNIDNVYKVVNFLEFYRVVTEYKRRSYRVFQKGGING